MCPNNWNAHIIQSEFLECTSIINEYTKNVRSCDTLSHSGTRVIKIYGTGDLRRRLWSASSRV